MANKGQSVQPHPTPLPPNSTGLASKAQPVLPDNDYFPAGGATSNKKKQKKQKRQQQQQNSSAQVLSNGGPSESHNMPEVSTTATAAPSEDHPDAHNLAPSSSTDLNVQQTSNSSLSNKKKKKTKAAGLDTGASPVNNNASTVDNPDSRQLARENSLWDTNGPEERSRIKAFWLNLSESERRDLVNIEKSHVLQKMKEQQKHSCSCSVCGRKRTAIEEELESLLKDPRIWADPTTNPPTDRLPVPTSALTSSSQHRHGYFKNKDVDEYDVDDQGEYSDEYEDEEDDYSDDDPVASSFFQFGNSLTVKDGLLTVADDLLKNDGQKFIDMMEQLAERRMQREEDARYSAAHGYSHGSLSPPHGANHLGEPPLEDDEYDDEDDEYDDDDADLDYDDEDEEDMDNLTEEQRMEEGRRMFQIFAARMFEQRVVTAYREKVAYERQQALIDEQEQDTVGAADAKKSKNAEKKKRQRQAAKEAKAQKEAAKEEEKQRKEAAARAVEEKKKEEQRLKQEEQRKKKEAEKKALEEKKRKKEAEAQKRLEAERERQQEQERKNREQKAEEKRRRDEAERKKREEKEARDREAQERHVLEDSERKERQDKAKPDGETQELVQKTDPEMQSAEPTASSAGATAAATGFSTPAVAPEPVQTSRSASSDPARRPLPPAAVAVPPALKSRASQTSHDSPSAKVATPALPKAPTPSRARETPNLQTSEPYAVDRTPQSRSSTSPKAGFPQSIQPPGIPLSRHQSVPMSQASQPPLMPPGVPQQPNSAQQSLSGQPFGSMPFGINGLPAAAGSVGASTMPRLPHGQQQSMFTSQTGFPHSLGSHPQRAGTHSMASGNQNSRAPFGDLGTGNFNQQIPQTAQPLYSPPQRERPPPNTQHARQLSNQFEGLSLDTQSVQQPAVSQPIGRPAPIKRPANDYKSESRGHDRPKSSTRNQDMDDLSSHLGSSALLDDTDEPLPTSMTENRRPSAAPGTSRASASAVGSPFDYVSAPFGSASRAPGENWNRTPAMPYGAPGTTSLGHSQPTSAWTGPDINSPSHGWGPTGGSSSNTNAFGIQSHHRSAGGNPRAVTVRMFTVQACKSLASQSSGVENTGFFDISDVVRVTVEGGRQMHLSPGIQLSEIRNILDTEGDSNNGGGTFLVRTLEAKGVMGNRTMVRWVPDQAPMDSYSRQSPFYHQHPAHHQPSYQGEHLQGGLGQGSAGGASGSRQGLGLGDVGSPVSDARLPNLGGLGRF